MGERFEPCTSLCKNKDFTNWSRGNPSPRTMAKLESPKKVVTIYIGKTRKSNEGSDFLDWLEVPGAFGSNLVRVECKIMFSYSYIPYLGIVTFQVDKVNVTLDSSHK